MGLVALALWATPGLNALMHYALPLAAGIWLTYVFVAMALPRKRLV
jgi:hypothetical protein